MWDLEVHLLLFWIRLWTCSWEPTQLYALTLITARDVTLIVIPMDARLGALHTNCQRKLPEYHQIWICLWYMMTSSNGNIFRVTGPLCGELTVTGECPAQRPVTRSFGVFFDLHLNKRLSKQSWGWWFKTPSRSLWRHSNEYAWSGQIDQSYDNW